MNIITTFRSLAFNHQLVLLTGTLGTIINLIGVSFEIGELNYLALFLGRVASLLYVCAVDRVRWWYGAPIGLALINVWIGSERLLFTELFFQSCIYQVSAFNLFVKVDTPPIKD